MPPDPSDAAYLWDMLDACRGVVGSVGPLTFEQYCADEDLRLAAERRIEIIGEAAGRVSHSFQKANPEIPWRKIIAQRHVLAHEYGQVDNDLIWTVVHIHVPPTHPHPRAARPNTAHRS